MKTPKAKPTKAVEFLIKKIEFGYAITKAFYVVALCPTKAWAEAVVKGLTKKE